MTGDDRNSLNNFRSCYNPTKPPAISAEDPQIPYNLMKNIRYKKKYLRNGISILILCLLTLSHTTRNSKRGGKRRKNADGDLKNCLPCVCFHLTHFDSILKVKLNILCVSHEVNFPWSVRTSGGVGRPWMRERWRNHRDRRGGFSCLQGAALSCNPRSCREWRVGVH